MIPQEWKLTDKERMQIWTCKEGTLEAVADAAVAKCAPLIEKHIGDILWQIWSESKNDGNRPEGQRVRLNSQGDRLK